ncbi:MAG: hypothetical protein OEV31_06460 [Gammaproteobacteria bacterium]|nr:hypothetical protein [Gammaproteobacteria bacterium]
MTTVQITLPDQLAQEAQAAGLLAAEAMERLLREAIERRAAVDQLFAAMDRAAAADLPEMSMEEIQAEVDAVRAERRARRERERAGRS